MANLEGMPISALPELTGDLQDEDEVVVYRPSTGKAYQANADLIDSSGIVGGYIRGDTNTSIDAGETVKISFGDTTGALSTTLRSSVIISMCGNTTTGYFDFMINTYGVGSRQHITVFQQGSGISYTEATASDGFAGIIITNNSGGALRYGMLCLVGYLPTVEIIES